MLSDCLKLLEWRAIPRHHVFFFITTNETLTMFKI